MTISCPIERIGLPPASEYVGFDFWSDTFLPPFKVLIRADLPPGGSCRVLAIRPSSDHPQLLSTSRHITQGIVDVTDERWDAASATLSARSKLVASDPYELRIMTPASGKAWNPTGVTVSAEDQVAGVKANIKQDGPRLRVTLASPTVREAKWQVRFSAAHADLGLSSSATNPQGALEPY